ncbi:MAG: hypothetical protein JNM34_02320 [Chthonomonadaceae bacterium]|nr:hypothetical protein [Chthonomonadaceae bacterium]
MSRSNARELLERTTKPIVLVLLVCAHLPALATWSVKRLGVLRPTSTTLDITTASGVNRGQVPGAYLLNNQGRAIIWDIGSGRWRDVHPDIASNSILYGTDGNTQVGWLRRADTSKVVAALCHGTADSWTLLDPPTASISMAYGVNGNEQVGFAQIGNSSHASVWHETADSWVDLNPIGASESIAYASDEGTQVGRARTGFGQRASVWRGTADSWVDLSPGLFFTSEAYDAQGGQQVGFVNLQGPDHAALWTGTPESWVDLHPKGFDRSYAYGVDKGFQVGAAHAEGGTFAGLWRGSADTWLDLSVFLPAHYGSSQANDIWLDGDTIWVLGTAQNLFTFQNDTIVWKGP